MKKIIAMLLLTALMASAVLTSCSSDSVDNSAETTTAANAETTAAETEETRIPSNLPENADLEGYVMKYYGAKLQKDTNNSDLGIYASEQNGDTINDAVYKRDSAVMEKYNFDIKYIECTDGSLHPVKTIKPIILAGDDAYDAFLDGAAEFTALAAEGMLVDMRTLENMDLDSPWWPQTIVDSLTIGDSLYAVVGSHMMNVKTFLYVTLFNHKLAANFGIDKNELDDTVYELILGECSINDCIIKDVLPNVSVLPSNVNLAAAEIELIGVEKKEFILKNEVDWIKDQYDYILIDCPPSLSMLTVNAMTTATSVLVPIQCEYYALEGLSQLIHTVNLVKERLNPELDMEGVVFTMYDSRTNLSMQVVENVKSHLNQKIYNTLIPRNIRLAEAPSYGMPITKYDSKSAGAEAYRKLAKEVMKRK